MVMFAACSLTTPRPRVNTAAHVDPSAPYSLSVELDRALRDTVAWCGVTLNPFVA